MKFLSIKSISAALFLSALLFSACTDLTDGYSTDPVNITDPTVITTDKFLSGTEVSLIGIYEGDMNRLTGMWTGHFSGEDRQYIGLGNYGVSGRDFNTEWAGIYSSVVKNAQIVKSRSHVEKNPRMLAVAQVTEAMAIGLAADLWGDVPFAETGQYPVVTTPRFDDQISVYNNVQVLLDSAIANFRNGDVPKGLTKLVNDADIFFGGDTTSWIATAHTLKARYYLHTKDYTNAVKFSQMGISDASGNMMASHGTSYLQNFNLFYSFLVYDRPGYMGGNGYAAMLLDSTTAVHRTNAKTKEDARLNYYYIPGAGIYVGGNYEPNFLVDFDWGSGPGNDGFFGATTSFPMVTFEENQLILAEALIKSNDLTGSLDALNTLRNYLNNGGYWSPGYNDPDNYAHLYLPYDASDFAPGGMENADNIADNDALLREIIEERYVTLTAQLEVYNDIRRTNNLLGIPVKAGNTTIPLRLLYPQSELNTNGNVPSSGVGLFEATKANTTPY